MQPDEVGRAVEHYKKVQSSQRRSLLFTLTIVTVLVLGVIIYAGLRTSKASQTEKKAEVTLTTISADTLQKVQDLDAQAQGLSHDQEPTLYLWRGGVHSHELDPQTAARLAALLVTRRHLIGDSGPTLSYSKPLEDYVCDHFWFVQLESVPSENAQTYLRRVAFSDPRYTTAETGIGSSNPSSTGIFIAFFVQQFEAQKIAKEFPSAVVRRWDFGPYQPNCAVAPTVSR